MAGRQLVSGRRDGFRLSRHTRHNHRFPSSDGSRTRHARRDGMIARATDVTRYSRLAIIVSAARGEHVRTHLYTCSLTAASAPKAGGVLLRAARG
jgi:hypothetical protein